MRARVEMTIDLNLCDKQLGDVNDIVPDNQRHLVGRIALGNNRLSELPQFFVDFTALRYVNIRSNEFHNFPIVVCSAAFLYNII